MAVIFFPRKDKLIANKHFIANLHFLCVEHPLLLEPLKTKLFILKCNSISQWVNDRNAQNIRNLCSHFNNQICLAHVSSYRLSHKLITTRGACRTIYKTSGMNRRWHQTSTLPKVIIMVMVDSPLSSSVYVEVVCALWVPTIEVSITNYHFVTFVVECLRPIEWFCIGISLPIPKTHSGVCLGFGKATPLRLWFCVLLFTICDSKRVIDTH